MKRAELLLQAVFATVFTLPATPNIDRLAREGLQLMNTYSQPSCTPTRATIMTGQLPIRTGMLRPMLPGEGAGGRGIDAKVTLPQKLREAGYHTEAIGKWHLGASTSSSQTMPCVTSRDHFARACRGERPNSERPIHRQHRPVVVLPDR